MQFADDTTIFVQDELSLCIVIKVLNKFTVISGLHLNKTKSVAVWIGASKYWKERVGGINWKLYPHNNVKILGVVLSPSAIIEEMLVNWESKMDSIEKAVGSWTMRNLSTVGKIQIVKSLLASKFSYIGSIVDLPQVFINHINSVFFKFVWGGSEKFKQSTLINDYDEGGLKMLNFKIFLDSLRISCLKN